MGVFLEPLHPASGWTIYTHTHTYKPNHWAWSSVARRSTPGSGPFMSAGQLSGDPSRLCQHASRPDWQRYAKTQERFPGSSVGLSPSVPPNKKRRALCCFQQQQMWMVKKKNIMQYAPHIPRVNEVIWSACMLVANLGGANEAPCCYPNIKWFIFWWEWKQETQLFPIYRRC